jgi:putative transposase
MPRRPRVNLVGYPQHIVQRGHNRAATYFGEDDYHCYLHWLKDSADKYDCAIHAYALMTNHVHLLISPSRPDGITRLMQSLAYSGPS